MQSDATIDDYRWLLSAEAEPWLIELADSSRPLHSSAGRLRKHFSVARTHLLLEQVELRERGRAKFEAADRMFFTRRGLEQSTDQWLATYKAARFEPFDCVADLCCGIGGDLLALTGRSSTLAVDRDPVALEIAARNVAVALGDDRAHRTRFIQAEVGGWHAEQFDAWHIDPDRRIGDRRTAQPEVSSPQLGELERLLQQNGNAALKLAPAAEVSLEFAACVELEWLSRGGECKQLVAWHGLLARDIRQRRATVVSRAGIALGTVVGPSDCTVAVAPKLLRYLFEPDAAVLAAGLDGALAARHGLTVVSSGSVLLTGDELVDDGCLARFEVVDMLPFDRRQLSRYLIERNVGRLEIKKRGVDIDPAKLRSELRPKGDTEATLFVTPVGGEVRAIVARRIPKRGVTPSR